MTSVRRDEQEGVVFPMTYDQDTKQPLHSFELMGGGGGRAFNTDAIIKRYEERLLMTVLADFIVVGHQSVGSYSLHTDKMGIFRSSLNSIAASIADTLNRYALPRLFIANGLKPENMPVITPTDIDSPDIAQLGSFMQAMAGTGVSWFPDGDLENFVRDAARLAKLDKEAVEQRRRLQMQWEATQFAQANAEYLQAEQGVTLAEQGDVMAQEGQTPAPGAGRRGPWDACKPDRPERRGEEEAGRQVDVRGAVEVPGVR